VRARIGVSVHVEHTDDASDTHYRVATRYARAVASAGAVPLLVPSHPEAGAPPALAAQALDGLLLSGGRGDRRSHFASGGAPSLRDTDPVRYDYEVALVRSAWEAGVPVMGICRGYQTLVEAAGGTLVPRLEPDARHPVNHDQDAAPTVVTHALRLARGSLLGTLFAAPQVAVNSFHRQGVEREPDGYRATAWSDDGLVEAVESRDGATIGVQFHPEWLFDAEPRWLGLFTTFVERAERRRRGASGRHGVTAR
jgi:putative glutamine amidotransferase